MICEFGAEGNVGRIRHAMEKAMERRGRTYENPFYFPSEHSYRNMLAEEGFAIEHCAIFDRPTPLNDGSEGMRHWIRQFFAEELLRLEEAEQAELLDEMDASLKEELWDGAQWVADYRRLRVSAVKNEKGGNASSTPGGSGSSAPA